MTTNVVPSQMEVKEDLPTSWQFFKHQLMNYEIATGLDKKW